MNGPDHGWYFPAKRLFARLALGGVQQMPSAVKSPL